MKEETIIGLAVGFPLCTWVEISDNEDGINILAEGKFSIASLFNTLNIDWKDKAQINISPSILAEVCTKEHIHNNNVKLVLKPKNSKQAGLEYIQDSAMTAHLVAENITEYLVNGGGEDSPYMDALRYALTDYIDYAGMDNIEEAVSISEIQVQFEKVIRNYFGELFEAWFLYTVSDDNRTYLCENTEAQWVGYLLCIDANKVTKLKEV